jgi:hypothetical protein
MPVSASGGSRSVLVAAECAHTASLHAQALPRKSQLIVDRLGTAVWNSPDGTEMNFAGTSPELRRNFPRTSTLSTVFPVPTPKNASFRGLRTAPLQFDLNRTSPGLRLFFSGPWF